MQENLLSIQEAAKILGVSTKTLRRWEARGILVPQRTTGAHRRYTLEQIENFKKNGSETPVVTEEISVELPEEIATENTSKKFFFNASSLTSKVQDFKGAFKLSGQQKVVLISSLSAFVFVVAFAGIVYAFTPFYKTKVLGLDEQIKASSKIGARTPEEVLAATIASPSFQLKFNAPSLFNSTVRVEGLSSLVGGIDTENANINAGTGTLTASNVIYSITAGQGISITPGQNPVISATSLGTVYTAGTGIAINGDVISSTLSAPGNSFGKIAVGSDTISAGGQDSTFTLAAGTGINLSANTGSSTVTISAIGGNTSPWEDNGAGVVSLVDQANSVTIGNTTDIFRLTVEGDIGPSQGATYDLGSLSEGFNGIYGETFFAGGNAGITQGTASCVTTVGGIVVGTGTCQLGSEQWVVSNGLIYTGIPSLDFALGGTSTASAKFAVTNIAGGTPTASISANNGGGATSLSGDGRLSTTNKQTLTLGSSTTGNIVLDNSSFGAATGNNAILYAVAGTGQIATATTSTQNLCLTSGATAPAWVSCSSAASNYWQLNGNALSPANTTYDILFGGTASNSAKFAFINVAAGTPTASISGSTTGNSLYITGDGNIATTNKQTLTLGSSTTGNVSVFGLGTGVVHSVNGVLSTGLVTNAELANSTITVNTGTGISVSGSPVALGGAITLNNTGVTSNIAGNGISVDQSTGAVTITNTGVTSIAGTANQVNVTGATGDITLSLPQDIDTGATPTFAGLTLSALTNAGGVLYTNGSGQIAQTSTGTAAQCLIGGSTPTWAACPGSGSVSSPFTELNGAIVPLNSTEDLLVGGQSSASAKFAFINTNSGTPTASISAGTTGNNTYLTGNGTLGTTNKQTLTLGSSTTGNIAVNGFGAGVVQSDANGLLSSTALNLAAGASYIKVNFQQPMAARVLTDQQLQTVSFLSVTVQDFR